MTLPSTAQEALVLIPRREEEEEEEEEEAEKAMLPYVCSCGRVST